MKLRTFDKMNASIKTYYHVTSKANGDPLDCFLVDYLGDVSNIQKKIDLIKRGAEVKLFDPSTSDPGVLWVYVNV